MYFYILTNKLKFNYDTFKDKFDKRCVLTLY